MDIFQVTEIFQVKFAKNANSGQLVSLKRENISFRGLTKNKSNTYSLKNVLVQGRGKCDSLIEQSIINSSQSVKYENISPNTDLQYVFSGSGLKENIIVKEKAG